MLLLPSDDLGSRPKMSKAIRSKGAPPLYICSLPYSAFYGTFACSTGIPYATTLFHVTPHIVPIVPMLSRINSVFR
ncbi:hypothetical protein TNCV_943891 [Trichonephila clavipes]|nr:hypothetical protein TNCV_943891 [Trichonephila clavipes]